MGEIRFEKVCKSFGSHKVIENLDLTIRDGSFTVLVGASGCGKTTLLRMIAGIGPATSGRIFMDGKDITDTPPAKRDIAMVFQNYAIYPTMTVRENIEFGLKNKRVPKEERNRLIAEYTSIVGLSDYLDRKPGTLSGGQRQRIALARAMVKKPSVFLMDEPLSNLDAKLRVAMRSELIELHNRLKTTFVYVTHDQTEAMSMADQIVLMDHGVIQQEAEPSVIYHDPNNIFTSQFIGTPPMNILRLPDGEALGFRPERGKILNGECGSFFRRHGKILNREMLGSETLYKVALANEDTVMIKSMDEHFKMGQEVSIGVEACDLYFFAQDGCRIRNAQDRLLRAAGGMNDA